METATAGPAARLVTAEELWAMGDDARRLELVAGEVRETAPTGFEHADVLTALTLAVAGYVKSRRLGKVVVGEPGFVLRREPDTVLAPDLAFVCTDRLPSGRRGFAELAPDLAVEVVSPSQSRPEMANKATLWLDAGVKVVWLVWPEQRRVQVHTGEVDISTVGPDGVLTCPELLPGFELPLSELFG